MSKLKTQILFFFLLTVIAGWRFFSGLDKTVYQCDEYSYLRKSYFLDLHLSGKFSDPAWQSGDATDQTKLMEYIYGIPSKLLYKKDFINLALEEGEKDNRSYANYSDWAVTYGQPAQNLKITPKLKNVFYTARIISAFLTTLYILSACLIIFWLFKSYFLTTLAFLFLTTQPILNIHGKQILADSALNLFLVLGLATLLLWWQAFWEKGQQAKRLIFLSTISGLIGGLAASTKLNGFIHPLIATAIFISAGLLLFFKEKIKNKKRKLNRSIFLITITITIAISITIVIFLGLHPNTWHKPISAVKKFISWRWYITGYYQGYFPEDNITSILQKINLIFLRIGGYMTGVGSIGFHYESQYGDPNKFLYLIPNMTLFILGITALVQKNFFKKEFKKLLFPALIWSITTILIVFFYLKLDWTRYYWPLFLPFMIVDGYGLESLVRAFKLKVQSQKPACRQAGPKLQY